jgi:hypothetical protein
MAAGIELYNDVLNQKGSPALYSDTFANRPAFGYTGRLFISTDTNEIYRDTGTAWVLISSGGGGVNIYNSDGTLTAARTVTMAGHTLTFEGGANVNRIIQSADNNVARILSWRTAGVQRWAIRVDGNETGSNAGADWALRSYNDAGTFIFAPISVRRSTGEIETFAEENITTGGQSIIGLYTNSTGTYAGGLTTTGGNPQSSNFNIYTLATAGSVTFANSNLVGTTVNVLRAQVQNAGTITFPASATSALRAATNFVSQLQYNTSAAAGTFTHMANIHLQGVYEVSGGNLFTITNAYQLLLNSLNENGYTGAQLALTNRWGIYQDGASDLNYFAANTLLGTTTNSGFKLDVNGTARTGTLTIRSTTQDAAVSTFFPTGSVGNNIFFGVAGTTQNGTAGQSSYNTGVGRSALGSLTTGFENTAIGYIAMGSTTTANRNVAVGLGALQFVSSGSSNTALGHEAGRSITSGANNTTSNNSVYIGKDTRASADGNTNEIVIGDAARGNGSNTSTYGNTSMVSHIFPAGNVGISQTTFGTSATRTLAISTGTAPSTSPADCFQLYSADVSGGGTAAAHFRTEGGAVIKVYQETTGVAAATLVGGGGTNITDTDTFDGYTLQQVVKALRNQGLLA